MSRAFQEAGAAKYLSWPPLEWCERSPCIIKRFLDLLFVVILVASGSIPEKLLKDSNDTLVRLVEKLARSRGGTPAQMAQMGSFHTCLANLAIWISSSNFVISLWKSGRPTPWNVRLLWRWHFAAQSYHQYSFPTYIPCLLSRGNECACVFWHGEPRYAGPGGAGARE